MNKISLLAIVLSSLLFAACVPEEDPAPPTGELSGSVTLNVVNDYYDFSAGSNQATDAGSDIGGTSNEGCNFGNEYAPSITGRRLLRLAASGSLDSIPTVPAWTDAAPWVEVSWDFVNGTLGQPVTVGELWVVYTQEGHYAVMEITALPEGGFGSYFTFDYKYLPDGSRSF